MKAYYIINSTQIILDFERPVLLNPSSIFFINDQPSISVQVGSTSDTYLITIASTFLSGIDDLWLKYIAPTLNPILYLSGIDRVCTSFEIPVTITNIEPSLTQVINTTFNPLIGDFIDAYGMTEAITITNPENALAISPNEYKLIRALEDGEALYQSYIGNNAINNSVVINAGKRRTILTFARYFLDSRCRRKVVTEDYENAVRALQLAVDAIVPLPPGFNSEFYTGEDFAYSSQANNCGC